MKKEESDSVANRFYNELTSPRIVKMAGYLAMGLYIGLVAIGVLIAAIFQPGGYTIWDNWISDLGGRDHTPVPILYDLACIFAGTLTIPFHFYLEKHLAPIPRTIDDYTTHRWAFRLTGLGWFISMIGSFFYIGVGIFSEDRDIALTSYFGTHGLCSYGAFGGFAFGALFIGIAFIFVHQDIIPSPYKYLIGIWGVFAPITVAMLNLSTGGPLLEWMLLFVILGWILPVAIFTMRHTERQEHIEE